MDTTINEPVEYEGNNYKTDDDGNLLDAAGDIFKNADEYKTYLENKNDGVGNDDNVIKIDEVEYKINDNGDALNEDGTVFKTKDELEALANNDDDEVDETKIIIDGVEYKVDDDGNAVDDKGEVFKTKEEIDVLLSDDDDTGIDVNKIAKTTGIEILDENNNPITYDNTDEGINAYVKDVYTRATQVGANQAINDLYAINPLIKSFVEHVKLNNTADGFNQTVAYSTIKLDEKNEDQLISVIRSARKLKGDSETEIEMQIRWAKDDKKLVELGKSSLKYLQANESEQSKLRTRQLEQKQLLEQQEYEKRVNNVSTILKDGTIKIDDNTSFTIPKLLTINQGGKKVQVENTVLIDYITTKRKYNMPDGSISVMTAFEAANYMKRSKQSEADLIIEAIQSLTGTSPTDLIKRSINSTTVKKVRSISTKRGSSGKGGSTRKPTKKPVLDLKYN